MIRLLMCCLIALPAFSQNSYQQTINAFVNDPQLESASVSISLIDTENGKVLASYDPHRTLIPASTLKLITTAAALHSLSPQYQFSTDLLTEGEIDSEGRLRGNLHIKGYGDPTLASHHFEMAGGMESVLQKMVNAVKTHGRQTIEGRVLGDASWLEGAALAASWPWEDIGNYYGSGAWGLNFHENLYFLHLQQKSRLGSRPEILKQEPEIPNLLLINEVSSAGAESGDNAYIFGGPYAYTRFVRGTIPVGSGVFKIKGSVPDPPFFAAYQLVRALHKAGIEVKEGATSMLEFQREGNSSMIELKSFFHHYSPRLKDIAREANLKSVNIYCEAMLKTMGKILKDEGSTVAGLKVVEEFLAGKGINTEGFFMVDGSGLSPRNGITSYQLAALLTSLAGDKEFKKTLAVGGQTGTLKYLFRGSGVEGRIKGKSGGMGRVRSYAGFAQTSSGKELAFCVIANNYTGNAGSIRKKMERLMIEFCK